MADQQHSRYQRRVIRDHYRNADKIGYQRLSELTTEIYLAEGKKADRLWKQVETALDKLEVPESRKKHVLEAKKPELLAKLVQELTGIK